MKGFCSVPRPPDCSEGFVRCGSVRQFEPILDTQQVVGARPANQGFRALEIDFRRGHFGERFNLFSQPGHHTGVPSPADMVLIPPAGAQQISPCKPGHQRVADSRRDSAAVPAGGLAVVGQEGINQSAITDLNDAPVIVGLDLMPAQHQPQDCGEITPPLGAADEPDHFPVPDLHAAAGPDKAEHVG